MFMCQTITLESDTELALDRLLCPHCGADNGPADKWAGVPHETLRCGGCNGWPLVRERPHAESAHALLYACFYCWGICAWLILPTLTELGFSFGTSALGSTLAAAFLFLRANSTFARPKRWPWSTRIEARPRSSTLRCAVCHDESGVGSADKLQPCASCGTVTHADCLEGGCPTLGCRESRPIKSVSPLSRV